MEEGCGVREGVQAEPVPRGPSAVVLSEGGVWEKRGDGGIGEGL